jgi:hypothetical protein
MKAVEYITEITPEGRINLPVEMLRKLTANQRTPVRVLLLFEETPLPTQLPRFAGRWQDDRSAEVIVAEVWESRNGNQRSEQFDW